MRIAGRHGGGLLACCVALLAALALPAFAAARPGALDRSFGHDGRVAVAADLLAPAWTNTSSFPPNWTGTRAKIADAADGSFATLRGNAITRHRFDGSLDPHFGDAGRVTVASVEGMPLGLVDIAIDSAGRVMAFGTAVDPDITGEIPGYAPVWVNSSFVVALRFNSRGDLDPGFGGGNGVFRSDLGLAPIFNAADDISLVETVSAKLDSQDRAILAVGEVGIPPSAGHSYFNWVTDTLVRLTAAGSLDPRFGGGDGVAADLLNRNRIYSDFCISSQDRPVVASHRFTLYSEYAGADWSEPTSPGIGWLTRLRDDGSVDRGFGVDGSRFVRGGSGPLGCDRSGGIAMLQTPPVATPRRAVLRRIARISPEGQIERGFGAGGRAVVKLPKGSELTAVVPGGRERVLLIGTLNQRKRGQTATRTSFTVIRLLASGKPDRRFGRGGWTRTGFGRGAAVHADGGVVDGLGRLLVVGNGKAPWLQPGGAILAGYRLGR